MGVNLWRKNKLLPQSAVWRDNYFQFHLRTEAEQATTLLSGKMPLQKVLEAVSEDKQRILLTLTTGTGNSNRFQSCMETFHSKWNINKDGERSPENFIFSRQEYSGGPAFNAFFLLHLKKMLWFVSIQAILRKRKSAQKRKYFLPFPVSS
ncbi:MAG: hypothetical protein IPM85_18480 [Chitinophagaceae bacterium]|nr:hypothetical protein [Chitinophagaceae bacterium]